MGKFKIGADEDDMAVSTDQTREQIEEVIPKRRRSGLGWYHIVDLDTMTWVD